MINIFIGYQNSGKTLAMTYFLYVYYLRGYKIYSNYNLNFEHEKINKEKLLNMSKSDIQFNKCIIAIDEIQALFDSRSSSTKENKLFSYLVLQSSKRDVHIFGTTQEFQNIEVRIRTNCNIRIFCNRYFYINKKYYPVKTNKRKLTEYENNILQIGCLFLRKRIEHINMVVDKEEFFIKAKPLFNLYNTRELVNF